MLSADTIRTLIEEKSLIEGYFDIDKQLQPNGFDFSVGSIAEFEMIGHLEINEEVRMFPWLIETSRNILADTMFSSGNADDYVLEPNKAYVIKLAEKINLPEDIAALARPRSSFIRVGASIHTGVWDSGYSGKSTILLKNGPNYLHVREGTRILQMVFFKLDKDTFGYEGIYQGEQ